MDIPTGPQGEVSMGLGASVCSPRAEGPGGEKPLLTHSCTHRLSTHPLVHGCLKWTHRYTNPRFLKLNSQHWVFSPSVTHTTSFLYLKK